MLDSRRPTKSIHIQGATSVLIGIDLEQQMVAG